MECLSTKKSVIIKKNDVAMETRQCKFLEWRPLLKTQKNGDFLKILKWPHRVKSCLPVNFILFIYTIGLPQYKNTMYLSSSGCRLILEKIEISSYFDFFEIEICRYLSVTIATIYEKVKSYFYF